MQIRAESADRIFSPECKKNAPLCFCTPEKKFDLLRIFNKEDISTSEYSFYCIDFSGLFMR
jgi:hypothetical protein